MPAPFARPAAAALIVCRYSKSALDRAGGFLTMRAMLAKVDSAAVLGIDAYPIEIEVNSGWGQPAVIIVGLPDAAVKESASRPPSKTPVTST